MYLLTAVSLYVLGITMSDGDGPVLVDVELVAVALRRRRLPLPVLVLDVLLDAAEHAVLPQLRLRLPRVPHRDHEDTPHLERSMRSTS